MTMESIRSGQLTISGTARGDGIPIPESGMNCAGWFLLRCRDRKGIARKDRLANEPVKA